MSILGEREEEVSKEELVEYLKRRIEELEHELRILKTILVYVDPSAVLSQEEEFDSSERLEDIRVGKKTVAKIGIGESYVRIVFGFPAFMPEDVREYLESVVQEIGERQAVDGTPPEERARLETKTGPGGELRMLVIHNLYTALEKVKAKAALKYVSEILYQLSKKKKA